MLFTICANLLTLVITVPLYSILNLGSNLPSHLASIISSHELYFPLRINLHTYESLHPNCLYRST